MYYTKFTCKWAPPPHLQVNLVLYILIISLITHCQMGGLGETQYAFPPGRHTEFHPIPPSDNV